MYYQGAHGQHYHGHPSYPYPMMPGPYCYPHGPYGMPHECYSRIPYGHTGVMHHPMSHAGQVPFYHEHPGYPVRYHPASYSEPYNPPGFGSCKHSHYGNESGRPNQPQRQAMNEEMYQYYHHMPQMVPITPYDPTSPYQ